MQIIKLIHKKKNALVLFPIRLVQMAIHMHITTAVDCNTVWCIDDAVTVMVSYCQEERLRYIKTLCHARATTRARRGPYRDWLPNKHGRRMRIVFKSVRVHTRSCTYVTYTCTHDTHAYGLMLWCRYLMIVQCIQYMIIYLCDTRARFFCHNNIL